MNRSRFAYALLGLAAALFLSGHALAGEPSGTRAIVPATRDWTAATGSFAVTPATRIVTSREDAGRLSNEASLLRTDLESIAGVSPRIASGRPRAGDIVLALGRAAGDGAEAYALEIGDTVRIEGVSAAGVFYGTQSLLQLLKLSADRATLARGSVVDSPGHAVRAIMLDAGRRYYEIEQIENLIRDMAWKKQNTLHLHFTDWPAFRLHSDRYPGLAPELAYDRAAVRRIQDTAARYHVTVIPEIDLPAHAVAITRYKPDLAFDCPSMRHAEWLVKAGVDPSDKAWTIDITRQANRDWVRDLLNEFIPWFDGPYFHIGGDEYQYDKQKVQCPELMDAMRARGFSEPGDVFVDWINEANGIVKAHGKQTIIWSWWTFLDNATSISPDKDIIIDVWNQPEEQAILDAGYRTLLSPEELLYVSPGIEGTGPDAYGVVDIEKVHERWEPRRDAGVLGYSVAVWADSAEHHTDQWFFGKAYEPASVVAERLWSGKASGSVRTLLARLNRVGLPPPVIRSPAR